MHPAQQLTAESRSLGLVHSKTYVACLYLL